MDEQWREMRRHLNEASESAAKAADAAILTDVRHLMNRAHVELEHAIFIREQIEKRRG